MPEPHKAPLSLATPRLGEILMRRGKLTAEGLQKGLELQKREKLRLGEALVRLGLLSEAEIAETLAEQVEVPFASIENGVLKPSRDPKVRTLLPTAVIRRDQVIPLAIEDGVLRAAMADPTDLMLVQNLRMIAGCEIRPLVATPAQLREIIERAFPEHQKEGELETEASDNLQIAAEAEEAAENRSKTEVGRMIEEARTAKVVRLVNHILKQAVVERASDIHFEPFADSAKVRLRIDGVLHEVTPPPKALFLPIVSRLKILSKMDIAEKRLPQDGGFTLTYMENVVDLRVSTIPTVYGEKMVIRLLNKKGMDYDLNAVGLNEAQKADVQRAARSPYGLLFITGPTGSGKTTTLYTLLRMIHDPKKNIVTVEDPVEYKLEGINQVNVKPSIGLTFAAGLRAFLRQDPDIMMVGEVRDQETAQICTRAALTGHLVLSTLHTNDALSAITRLIDLGVEPFLLAPSLLMVVAQRLVRVLCPRCKEAYTPDPATLDRIGFPKGSEPRVLYRARGCAECRQTGYSGRIGIFDSIFISEEIRQMLFQQKSIHEIGQLVRAKGVTSLKESGLEKVARGVTTLEEVIGATRMVED